MWSITKFLQQYFGTGKNPDPLQKPALVCVVCGQPIEHYVYHTKRYCSERCRYQAKYDRLGARRKGQ